MFGTELSNEVLAGFLYTFLGAVAIAIFTAVVGVGRKYVVLIRGAKAAPTAKESADVAALKHDVAELKESHRKVTEWLVGSKDIRGNDKHDGFIETFPLYQNEVRGAITEIGKKLDQLPGVIKNGHPA